ncbi:hypothetical protein ES703_10063 [subsurface metagenome]
MDDFTFGLLYSVVGAALIGVLLFLLSRKLDRRLYIRPVVYGFFFGAGVSVLFGGGIFAFLIGGAVTGYLLAREVRGWWSQFRAGGVNGILIVSSPILANMFLLFTRGISDIIVTQAGPEEVLLLLYEDLFLYAFMLVAIVGIGAVLGGLLRKLLKPAEQDFTGSGVGQVAGKT